MSPETLRGDLPGKGRQKPGARRKETYRARGPATRTDTKAATALGQTGVICGQEQEEQLRGILCGYLCRVLLRAGGLTTFKQGVGGSIPPRLTIQLPGSPRQCHRLTCDQRGDGGRDVGDAHDGIDVIVEDRPGGHGRK